MRTLLIVVVLLSAACGSSPTQPSATPPPAPPPDTRFEAVTDSFAFGTLGAEGWPYTHTARNVGPGCATRVRGTTRFLDHGAVVLTIPWAMDTTRVIRPGETLDIAGCCVGTSFANRDIGWNATFEWDTVRC
jgi:hypothetical protein